MVVVVFLKRRVFIFSLLFDDAQNELRHKERERERVKGQRFV